MNINRLYLFIFALFLSYIFCPLVTVHWPLATAFASDWDSYQKSGHKSPKWNGFVEAGFSSFESGNLGSAELLLQRAIARGCSDGLVYAKIGLYYEASGNYKKATEFFKKAVKKLSVQYPAHETTLSIDEFLGRALYLSGDISSAEPYLKKALSKRASFTSAYFLGLAYKANGDMENAVIFLEKALQLPRPKNISAGIDILIMTDIGKTYFDKKDFDRSLEWWQKILTRDPGNKTALEYKAEIDRQKFKEREKKVLEEIVK